MTFFITDAQKKASLLAQLVERGTVNPEAVGSIPTQRESVLQRSSNIHLCFKFLLCLKNRFVMTCNLLLKDKLVTDP